MTKVFVTGMGLITSLGDSVEANRNALRSGKSGITSIELFKSKYADLLPFAEIKISTEKLKETLTVNSVSVTRTSLLALHACRQAIDDSGLDSSQIQSMRTAIIGANTVGGMCLTDELYRDANSKELGSPYLASYDAGSVTLFLQDQLGLKGIANTINTACSSSASCAAGS